MVMEWLCAAHAVPPWDNEWSGPGAQISVAVLVYVTEWQEIAVARLTRSEYDDGRDPQVAWVRDCNHELLMNVTHWAYLPEPPLMAVASEPLTT